MEDPARNWLEVHFEPVRGTSSPDSEAKKWSGPQSLAERSVGIFAGFANKPE